MDFLNPLINQARELFASMTPGARITAGLLLAVVVVSLGFLFQQATVGPDEFLFGGDPIGRGRLPRMEAAMADAGIDYEVVGNRIKVSRAQRNDAIGAIGAAGQLPPEHFSLMAEALNGGSMFEFREQKMQRLDSAFAAQASLELSKFPWLESARVIHRVREGSGLGQKRQDTAAVTVMPHPNESITSGRLRAIKDYVSKACAVPMDQVVVTNLGGDLLGGSNGVSPGDFDNEYFKLTAMQEDAIEAKIYSQLSFIPGVRVKVKAELNDTAEQTKRVTRPEGETVQLSTVKSKTNDEQTVGIPGDRVGAVANASGPPNVPREGAGLARQDQSVSSTSNTEIQSGTGVSETTTRIAGYKVEEADASVAIPLTYVEEVYNQENLDENGEPPETPDPQALAAVQSRIETDVEELVQPLLPKLSLGEDEFRQVNVKFFRDLPQDPIAGPSLASNALGWIGSHTNTLAMAGLAVFGLVMLRSVVSGAKESPVAGLPALQLDGEPLADVGGDDDDEARPKLKLRKPETLKDDLSDMVSSDPDAAAAILKSWINNAA